MKCRLPVDRYSWMTEEEISNFDIDNVDLDSEEGYILEVDLIYPEGSSPKSYCKNHNTKIIFANFRSSSPSR